MYEVCKITLEGMQIKLEENRIQQDRGHNLKRNNIYRKMNETGWNKKTMI